MSLRSRSQNLLGKAIRHIEGKQRVDGGFDSLSSIHRHDFTTAKRVDTSFFTSLISLCLEGMQTDVGTKALPFLISQLYEGSANYWNRSSREYVSFPYPDDWDDTSCLLAAIHGIDTSIITPEVLASTVRKLTATESKAGGPYRTWIVGPDAEATWQDIDLAVNANIAFFLSRLGINLPELQDYLIDAVSNRDLTSRYYDNPYPVAYFLARTIPSQELADAILAAPPPQDPLQRSLLVSTLIRCKQITETIEKYLKPLLDIKEFAAYALYPDPVIQGKLHHAGDSALTAAFIAESLNLYLYYSNTEIQFVSNTSLHFDHLFKETVAIKEPLRSGIQRWLLSLSEKDKDGQIFSLGQDIANALKLPLTESVSQQITALSVFGWIAYTIADDFFDSEGQPSELPISLWCLREMQGELLSLTADDTELSAYVSRVMSDLDAANAWELAHCRIPLPTDLITWVNLPDFADLHQLAERSFGHALGPLILLAKSDTPIGSRNFQAIASFFHHFLIARQLNDDAHDWKDDLLKGIVTAVGALVLQAHETATGSKEANIRELNPIFWEDILPTVCDLIEEHVRLARESLSAYEGDIDTAPFERLLKSSVVAAQKARKEQQSSRAFLDAYQA